jgi:hypothetical protein
MTAQEVLTLRVTLLHGGYSPLPLIGKAPALKEWQKRIDTSEGDIQIWSKVYPAAANTGILTRLTPALDLDLLDADAAAAAEEFVRERYEEAGYVLTRIGRAPKRAILFRTQEPFAKIIANLVAPNGSTEKIEFLADGQQLPASACTLKPSGPIRGTRTRPARSRRRICPISARPMPACWSTGWPRCWSRILVMSVPPSGRAAKRTAPVSARHMTAPRTGSTWLIVSVPAKRCMTACATWPPSW